MPRLRATVYSPRRKGKQEFEDKKVKEYAARQKAEAEALRKSASPPLSPKIDQVTSADKFLQVLFKFTKHLSIFVVVCGMLTILVCSIWFIVVTPDIEPIPSQLPSPKVDALERELAESKRASNASESNQPAGRTTPDMSPIERQYGTIVKTIAERHKLEGRSYDVILSWIEDLDSQYQGDFALKLRRFLVEASSRVGPNRDKILTAIKWFHLEYRISVTILESQQEDVLLKNAASREQAATTRYFLTMVFISAIAFLLTFLILPLLIEIEQNTRFQMAMQKHENTD